ncbi:hypothetical protein ACFRAO_08105 [Streptomyces sp. NPDC056656]
MTVADVVRRRSHPGPTSHPVPQWTRPDTTPVTTVDRHCNHH